MPGDPDAHVECHAGYRADERPLRFAAAGRQYEVEQVLERWYGPDQSGFRVRVTGGAVWLLRRSRDGRWSAAPA